ncbi:MAG: sigma-54 dependent transcriptional regulator [Desulfobulbaceae bacterium]|nr:sigma-54 dependent transcriptional regulator [Desulfobulbaceae bacterium]
MAHVLIIDDNKANSSRLHNLIEQKGYTSSIAANMQEAMRFSQEKQVDVVLMNSIILHGKQAAGLQLLHKTPSAPEVIILAETGSAEEAEFAIEHGAWDYIVSSHSSKEIFSPLSKVIGYREKRKKQNPAQESMKIKAPGIVGNSARLKACLATLMQAAQSDASMLINGETGTGKELFATALHENSPRNKGNFVVVDCAALPETLIESTLFGHEKGAFTGATQKQAGLVKQADGGTLFLDEVGELPLSLQKTFLRVLEERQFRPVGSKNEVKSDFRLVAATNQDLDAMVEGGTFREDLLFRLRTFSLELPALRVRPEDITPLVKYFIGRRQKNNPMFNKKISADFLTSLRKYHWPGNVRELFHALERSLAAAQVHTTLFPYHLPTHIRVAIAKASLPQSDHRKQNLPSREKIEQDGRPNLVHSIDAGQKLQQIRDEVLAKTEELYLQELIAVTGGDMSQAITVSGLSRSRLYQLFKDHGVSPATGKK